MVKSGVLHYPKILAKRYGVFAVKYVNSYISLVKTRLIDNLDNLNTNNVLNDELQNTVEQIKFEVIRDPFLLNSVIFYGKLVMDFTKGQLLNSLSAKYDRDLLSNMLDDRSGDMLKSWASTNARLIKTIPTNLLDEVANIIESGYRSGESLKSIKDKIKKRFDITEVRAMFIASNEISNLHSDRIKSESLRLGISNYGWSTTKDDKTRRSHRVLDNKTCSWKDNTIYKNKPLDKKWLKRSSINATTYQVGKDFNCRCVPYLIF